MKLQIPLVVSESSVNRGQDYAQKADAYMRIDRKLARMDGAQAAVWYISDWYSPLVSAAMVFPMDRRRIDASFYELAAWRLSAGETAVEELLGLVENKLAGGRIRRDDLPHRLTMVTFSAAVKVYKSFGEIGLW